MPAFHLEAYLTGLSYCGSEPTQGYIYTSQLNNRSGQLAQTGQIHSIQFSLPIEHGGDI